MGASVSGSEASSQLARAVGNALALEQDLRRRPGAASTCRDAAGAIEAVNSAAWVDTAPCLPAPLVEGLLRLVSVGTAVKAGYAAKVIQSVTAAQLNPTGKGCGHSRVSQVGSVRGPTNENAWRVQRRAGRTHPGPSDARRPSLYHSTPRALSSPLLLSATQDPFLLLPRSSPPGLG
jgi:hypothetical protein